MKIATSVALFFALISPTQGIAHDNLSGSRLKKVMAEFTDGAQMLIAFYDTKFKTDCTFREDTQGKFRCYPNTSFSDKGTRGVYLDSQCTILSGGLTRNPKYLGSNLHYAVYYDGHGKVSKLRGFTWRNKKKAPRYTKNRSGRCKHSTIFSKSTTTEFKMGREIDLTEFVEVTKFRRE